MQTAGFADITILTRKVARQLKDLGMELLQGQVSMALKPGNKRRQLQIQEPSSIRIRFCTASSQKEGRAS